MKTDQNIDQLFNDNFLDILGTAASASSYATSDVSDELGLKAGISANESPISDILNPVSESTSAESISEETPFNQRTASEDDENKVSDNQQVVMMDLYQIEPDRNQPRRRFDPEKIEELSQSIAQYGLLQPLLVQKADGYYKIIAGERRYRAARMAGLTTVPVIVKSFDEQERMAVALIENLQRESLNPMEECSAYQKLMDDFHMTQEQIAAKLGKSRSSIANSLRLQHLTPAVQKNLTEGLLSLGHAKVLLGIEDEGRQSQLALKVIGEHLSVRDLEDLVNQKPIVHEKKQKKEVALPSLAVRLAQQQLSETLGCKVTVTKGARKGKIEIDFFNEEDLERIVALIQEGN